MYKRSEQRYAGGGLVRYLVYRSPQTLRGGRRRQRVRTRRLYFPTDAKDIRVEQPSDLKNRTGRRVHGVAVHYRYQLAGATARRGNTRYKLPERWVDRQKVVQVPQGASSVKLVTRPPEGSRMGVA